MEVWRSTLRKRNVRSSFDAGCVRCSNSRTGRDDGSSASKTVLESDRTWSTWRHVGRTGPKASALRALRSIG
jgi:hypothetical protein